MFLVHINPNSPLKNVPASPNSCKWKLLCINCMNPKLNEILLTRPLLLELLESQESERLSPTVITQAEKQCMFPKQIYSSHLW